jgi:putative two-component system response regulator
MNQATVAHHTHAKILIVDDELNNLRYLERLLTQAGYTQVSTSADPGSVTDICVAQQTDLLLLDLHMPGINGLQVLESMKAACSPMPFVIMLTADNTAEARLRALSSGARDFLTKPFDSIEVLLRINNLLDLRVSHVRLHAQNRRLAASVAARTSELEEARLEVIEKLALAAEMRDGLTGHHIRRVGEMAAAVARTLGLPPEECEVLRRSAPLHDVGKIGLPDRILHKRGPLNPAQRKAMERHTLIGARLLAGSASVILQQAQQIALCHHERWDGTGYPRGLSGHEIPQAARIVAVADFFDAMVHDRPYRAALSRAQALDLVREGSGSHFDPEAAAALLKVLRERDCAQKEACDRAGAAQG